MTVKTAVNDNGIEPLALIDAPAIPDPAPAEAEPKHPPDYPTLDMSEVSWFDSTEILGVGQKVRLAFRALSDSEDGLAAAISMRDAILEYLSYTAKTVKFVPLSWLTKNAIVPEAWTAETLAHAVRPAHMQWLISDMTNAIVNVPND